MAESEEQRKAKANIRAQAWYDDNKERKKAYDKQRYAEKRDVLMAEQRARREADPELHKARDRAKYVRRRPQILEQKLQKAYGLSRADFDLMLFEQGGRCAICRTDDWKGRHGSPCVDHCHQTGAVRGILCTGCNTGLGKLGDTAESLERALAYLKKQR